MIARPSDQAPRQRQRGLGRAVTSPNPATYRRSSPSTSEEARVRRVAQLRRAVRHRLEDRRHVRGRAADDAQDLGDRRLLLQRFRDFALRACSSLNRRTFSMAITAWSAKVLSRLIWWSLKRPRLTARDIDRADRDAFSQHGHEQHAPKTSLPGHFPPLGRHVRIRFGVVNAIRRFRFGRSCNLDIAADSGAGNRRFERAARPTLQCAVNAAR